MNMTDITNLINTVLGGSTTSLILKIVLIAIITIIGVYFAIKKAKDAQNQVNNQNNSDQNSDQAGTATNTQPIANDNGANDIDNVHNRGN